jgi:hypothetical protein
VIRVWHLLLAVVVLASFVIQVSLLLAGGQDVNSGQVSAELDLATRFVRLFSYFTIQSNLIVLCTAIAIVLDPQRDGRIWRVVRLDSLLGIAVTGIVFATLLSGIVHHQGASVWANAGFHYFSPLWTVLGWFLFGPRMRIDWRTIGLAFVWPAAWLAYTLIRGASTGWYPYPFLDVGTLGYGKVVLNMAAILSFAFALAVMLMTLDRRRQARRGAV